MTTVALVAHWDWVLYNFRLPVAKRLRDEGFDVVVVCPPGKYVDLLTAQGLRYVGWDLDRRSFRPVGEARAISQLAKIYRNEKPEVVHHFTIKPNVYGTLAAKRAGVPHVINTFSGMGFLLSESWSARGLNAIAAPLMRALFSSGDVWTIFQNTDDLESSVRRRLVPKERTILIEGSGVDPDVFRPAPDSAARPPVFLMAARLIKEKGIGDFVTAARELDRAGVAARFLVAGEPDPGNPSSHRDDEIDSWNRESPVQFIGHVADMASLLAAVDVAVLPTYYPEGLPRFLLEAAASGLPLIATDIPPCRPIVKHGLNGYLVPPRDPEALAGAMARLAENPESRREFGQNGRRLVMERFREQDVVDQYVSVYERLLRELP